tara:strand:- start:744 stop:1085 length:342 start_codon:yes stop_codon:yes gene_type:complete
MLKRLFAVTTLFSIYIFPASAGANINLIELNYETVGMPKEEIKNSHKDKPSGLISKKITKNNSKKGNSFLNFLGLLLLSYALIEISGGFDSDSSSTNNNNNNNNNLPVVLEIK